MRLMVLFVALFLLMMSSVSLGSCDRVANYLVICEDQYYGLCFEHVQRISGHHTAYDRLEFSVYSLSRIAAEQGGYQPRSYKEPPTMIVEASPGLSSPDSTAIKRFVRDWVNSLPVSQRDCAKYLLIVGKGVPSYRFRPRHWAIRRWHRWVSYDDPYVDIDDDGKPDFPVARICPSNFGDLRNWSNKVFEMMLSDPDDPFHKKTLILAEDGNLGDLDGGQVGFWAKRLQQRKLPHYLEKTLVCATDVDPVHLDPQTLQDYILPIFNEGFGIVIGIGTYASVFDFVDFFSTKYANLTPAMLTNRGKYPVMLGFSCEIGRWDTTAQYARITDVFNFARDGGSVLSIAPTAVTLDISSEWLLDALIDSVFSGRYKTWGDAFVAAKNEMHGFRFHKEIWWEYGLFGEPSLPIRCYEPPAGVIAQPEVKPEIGLVVLGNPAIGFSASVKLTANRNCSAMVTIYDVRGRLVRVIHEGGVDVGEHVLRWDCRDDVGERVSPGIYFVRSEVEGSVKTAKIVVLR